MDAAGLVYEGYVPSTPHRTPLGVSPMSISPALEYSFPLYHNR